MIVIPAKPGMQEFWVQVDSGFRRNDGLGLFRIES